MHNYNIQQDWGRGGAGAGGNLPFLATRHEKITKFKDISEPFSRLQVKEL